MTQTNSKLPEGHATTLGGLVVVVPDGSDGTVTATAEVTTDPAAENPEKGETSGSQPTTEVTDKK